MGEFVSRGGPRRPPVSVAPGDTTMAVATGFDSKVIGGGKEKGDELRRRCLQEEAVVALLF